MSVLFAILFCIENFLNFIRRIALFAVRLFLRSKSVDCLTAPANQDKPSGRAALLLLRKRQRFETGKGGRRGRGEAYRDCHFIFLLIFYDR